MRHSSYLTREKSDRAKTTMLESWQGRKPNSSEMSTIEKAR